MARRNRVSVPDGTYHITSRIVNQEMWLKNPKLKDEIVQWLYGTAAFSGVELLAWCIMDNHFHVLVHVPEVPVRYRLNPDAAPASHAFGMRPPECNPALWPDGDSPRQPQCAVGTPPPDGDSPRQPQCAVFAPPPDGDSPRQPQCAVGAPPPDGDSPRRWTPRPPTGFMLSDEEMLERLGHLYGNPIRVQTMRTMWAGMRSSGNGAAVDAVKERYCRRMYNVSQFVKTLKERVAQAVNRRTGHVGHVFEGRFHSGLVEGNRPVAALMALYIDFNPHKAGLVKGGDLYVWSSFGQACGAGPHAAACRAAYERIFGCPWSEARRLVLEAFAARLPLAGDLRDGIALGGIMLTPAQLIHLRVPALSRGAFIGSTVEFGRACVARLAPRFPHPSFRSLEWLAHAVDWTVHLVA